MSERFDLVVVGGGHAGCEAASAAARLGVRTLLLTSRLDAIGRMSCNPAIGGVGKGHLVREVDALGGVMGQVADRTGIQFRLLNRSQGGAVRGPRAQCDKGLYEVEMRRELERLPGLELREGEAVAFHVEHGRVTGVEVADGGGTSRIEARGVVLTAGTFLRGVLHTGLEKTPGGRVGESPSLRLSLSLERVGLRLGRFKTGTPPRIHRDSIDFSRLAPQPGDEEPELFSFRHRHRGWRPELPQVDCHLARTNDEVHETIRQNLDRSPLYSGRIEGIGPRYCPSIEDKVVRFAERESHQVFVEPEGLDTPSTYLNGVSTSLPSDVQERFLRAIPGFEQAQFLRFGYAVEYDFVYPEQLEPTLEVRDLPGLFLAGQVNGTSGYEEAAAQGLWAGANAALSLLGREPFLPGRGEAYLGVLVDDLVRRGTDEPYRMFTSRAEYRLLLGCDTVVERLVPRGIEVGLIPEEGRREAEEALDRWRKVGEMADRLEGERVVPDRETLERWGEAPPFSDPRSAWDLLRRPGTRLGDLERILPEELRGPLGGFRPEERESLEDRARYDAYVVKMKREVARFESEENLAVPPAMRFLDLSGLSRECAERLERVRPRTLGAAARIPGMTPAAVTRLRIEIERGRREAAAR